MKIVYDVTVKLKDDTTVVKNGCYDWGWAPNGQTLYVSQKEKREYLDMKADETFTHFPIANISDFSVVRRMAFDTKKERDGYNGGTLK